MLWASRIMSIINGLLIYYIAPNWKQFLILLGLSSLGFMSGWLKRDSRDDLNMRAVTERNLTEQIKN